MHSRVVLSEQRIPRTYVKTLLGAALVLASSICAAQAQNAVYGLTTRYNFQGGISGPDGGTPYGGLIIGADGNYYGTTWYGGTGGGTIFKLTPAGQESIVYAFSGSQDGQLPSKLVQAADGSLYGTAYEGGSGGAGIIFRVTLDGQETILQTLSANGGPTNPGTGLTLGNDGNFYGTSTGGGTNGAGTVFRLTPAGDLTVVYSFGGSAGSRPAGELIQVKSGDFYGTTSEGGEGGFGTVFRINARGVLKVLHAFTGGSDGAYAAAPLIYGLDGSFYGTTQAGGAGNCAFDGLPTGCGTVFRVTATGVETVVHQFEGYPGDGSSPVGGLVQGKDGTLYGTTEQGGYSTPGNCGTGCGTLFSVTPAGDEKLLFACGEPPDPWYADCWVPSGSLLLGSGGVLTGTSQNGGGGWGNVFAIAPVPTLAITATPAAIHLHKSTVIKWTSTFTESCSASGAWNGTVPTKGQQREVPVGTGAYVYALTCTGTGGSVTESASVTVTQ